MEMKLVMKKAIDMVKIEWERMEFVDRILEDVGNELSIKCSNPIYEVCYSSYGEIEWKDITKRNGEIILYNPNFLIHKNVFYNDSALKGFFRHELRHVERKEREERLIDSIHKKIKKYNKNNKNLRFILIPLENKLYNYIEMSIDKQLREEGYEKELEDLSYCLENPMEMN